MKLFVSLILILILVLNYVYSHDFFIKFEENFNDSILNDAIYSFAIAKALNGIISVIQSFEISFSLFVGATIQIGQILDPVNDLIERFSWIMLASSVSLGIQKLLLIFGKSFIIEIIIYIATSIAIVLLWIKKFYFVRIFIFILKFLSLLLILKFGAVFFSYTTNSFYNNIYFNKYEQSNKSILEFKNEYKNIEIQKQKMKSIDNQSEFDKFLLDLEFKMEVLSHNIIELITIFVVTTILFPLVFLYLMFISIKITFNINVKSDKIALVFKKEVM